MFLVNHFHDLCIYTIGEISCHLGIVADLAHQRLGDLTHRNHAVRIPYGHTGNRIQGSSEYHILIDHLTALTCYRNIIAVEG